jgi:hypothetical protein
VSFALVAFILIVGVRGALVNAEFHALDAVPLLPVEMHMKVADFELCQGRERAWEKE